MEESDEVTHEIGPNARLDWLRVDQTDMGTPTMALSGKLLDDIKALLDLYGMTMSYDYGEGWMFESKEG